MNKEQFLGKLKECLSILEDQEQEDILAEYAQHIDMKMQKGLSEEEAIKDFGAVEELAAEILEAYHVKPEFKQRDEKNRIRKQKKENIDKNLHESLDFVKSSTGRIKEKLVGAFRAVGRGFRWIGEKCLHFGRWLMAPFRRNAGRRAEKITGGQAEITDKQIRMQGTKEMGGRIGKWIKAAGRGIVTLWKALMDFCIWWIRLFWNLGWIMFALFCAFFCMTVLAGAGAMSVLLFQGYPFIGLFLVCFGGILIFGALTGGAFSLVIRKKKIVAATAECEKTGYESAACKEAAVETAGYNKTERTESGDWEKETDRI